MRISLLTPVRLLGEAVSLALAGRDGRIRVEHVRDLAALRRLIADGKSLELVVVDTTQPVDLDSVRHFHCEFPDLPLLALGLREQEAEIIAHGSAGFIHYLRREDGLDELCSVVEDAIAGRMQCSPEMAGAIMRGLFRNGPVPATMAGSGTPLTRREHEIEQLVVRGFSNKEIAREFDLSESTVKHHVHSILAKKGVPTRVQLMRTVRDRLWPQDQYLRLQG